ncbi:MAG: hypothetical protein J0I54_06395 [Bosea sp.]|uniref:hypothetical protein n=1 Tax=unclassified Bosea (in: a-proteobacteria) TaxID=2653178 RepID=UPI000AA292B1|nr:MULTISPECIES: hypothetical protein [unclassified Bosea (in: a-proteobacteria)]MBN9456239.1 hypothetical protein [Bosea sp. (in: a-proteobacteria)]
MRRLDAKAAGYLLAGAAFVIAWVILCWPWLSGSVTIPFDAKAHFQAQVEFLARAIHSGQSPFWNHNVFAGSPQVADPQSLIFSPAILLALLSPAPSFRMVDAFVLLHLLVAGFAVLMFFRDRGWHPAGGLLAALVFAFGASAAWRVQHIGQIESLAFFAVAFWLTARMLQRNSAWAGVCAGLASGLMVLEPDQVAMLGGYVLIGMVVAHWLSGGWVALRASLVPIALASLAGLAVITVPLLWTWLFAEATTRPEISLGVATSGSLHPASLLTAFVGDLFGAKSPQVDFWGPYLNPNWVKDLALSQNMAQVYIGALPMLLLIAPGLTRGWLWDRAIRPLTLLFLFMVLYALGRYTPLFEAAYDYLPGVKMFRRPADATFLIGALGAVLSGYVLHRMLTAENISFRRDLAIGAAAVLAAVLGAILLSRNEGHLGDAWQPVLAAVAWFGAAIILLLALQRWRGALGPVAAIALVTGVVASDLGANNGPNESTALPPQLYDVLRPTTRNQTIALLKQLTAQPAGSPRRDRVELLGMGFEWPNAGMIHGFDHTLGYNPLRLEDFSEAVGTGDGIARPADRKFTPLFPSYHSRLANLLGLRYIASPVPIEQVDHTLKSGDLKLLARTKQGFIYENPHALPRVQFVGGWALADFESMKLSGHWPETDPEQTVLLDTEPPVATPEGPAAVQAEVKLVRYRNTVVEIEVTSPAAGFVVLNDIWHPWWSAQVDGVDSEILRANVLFRAVQVPAGRHKVVFSFHPLSGAIAELEARLAPKEPADTLPLPPRPERGEPQVVSSPGEEPLLSGLSPAVRDTLGLGPARRGAAVRDGTASAQIFGEPQAR